jgi:hypothetical protein
MTVQRHPQLLSLLLALLCGVGGASAAAVDSGEAPRRVDAGIRGQPEDAAAAARAFPTETTCLSISSSSGLVDALTNPKVDCGVLMPGVYRSGGGPFNFTRNFELTAKEAGARTVLDGAGNGNAAVVSVSPKVEVKLVGLVISGGVNKVRYCHYVPYPATLLHKQR